MDFAIAELMDEEACYAKHLHWLHPDGLACPRCGARDALGVHRRHRAPILESRCTACRRVFNAFTGTALQGSRRSVVELMLILRGFAPGVPTAELARELGCDRKELLRLRHRLQHSAWQNRDQSRLDDPVAEADEMDQNAGEKRLGRQNLLDRRGGIGYAWYGASPGADRCPDGPPGPSRPATWTSRP
jgi:transposase-like protein